MLHCTPQDAATTSPRVADPGSDQIRIHFSREGSWARCSTKFAKRWREESKEEKKVKFVKKCHIYKFFGSVSIVTYIYFLVWEGRDSPITHKNPRNCTLSSLYQISEYDPSLEIDQIRIKYPNPNLIEKKLETTWKPDSTYLPFIVRHHYWFDHTEAVFGSKLFQVLDPTKTAESGSTTLAATITTPYI